jgi:hypothetical protein
MYNKLGGMTELQLPKQVNCGKYTSLMEIPTNRGISRKDKEDFISKQHVKNSMLLLM